MDRGTNRGIAGDNMHVVTTSNCQVKVSGIDNHKLNHLPIVTARGVVDTQRGEVIVILNQYTHLPSSKIVLSSVQIESFGSQVNNKCIKVCDKGQCIITADGYIIPICITEGLAYLPICPFKDMEWITLQHIVLTSNQD